MARFQTASQDQLPPAPDLIAVDPVVADRTVFGPGRTHRYTLFRYWGPRVDAYCAFIGMNPSGADEASLDRTVARCCGFARRWGFDALYMLNAFSLRATDSDELYSHPDPVGPENDAWIRRVCEGAGRVVVAWGNPGGDFERGRRIEALLRGSGLEARTWCFGRNRSGTPVHPLYQPSDAVLIPYLT